MEHWEGRRERGIRRGGMREGEGAGVRALGFGVAVAAGVETRYAVRKLPAQGPGMWLLFGPRTAPGGWWVFWPQGGWRRPSVAVWDIGPLLDLW